MGAVSDEPERRADLHVHSSCSDGTWSPEEIVSRSADLGLGAVSIADHDSIGATESSMAAGSRADTEIVPGVELSATHGGSDVHVLGYFFDASCAAFRDFVSFLKEERRKRAARIVGKLNGMGLDLSMDHVLGIAGGASVGRPHIAEVLAEKGLVPNYGEAFKKYLAYDSPAYVPKYKISIGEAVEAIHGAGGLAFLAHPGLTGIDRQVLEEGLSAGIEGIEVTHPRHTARQVQTLRAFCMKHGLLESGGSDFHGERRGEVELGDFTIPFDCYARIRDAAGEARAPGALHM